MSWRNRAAVCDQASPGHDTATASLMRRNIMSVTSNSAARPASVTGIPEGMGFWVVVALVFVAIIAGAFVFSGNVPDGVAQAPYVGP
jgi:hypothetical protein